ncbi:MAG: hypothetical protein WDA17_00285 [Sphaerochaetaceae bacterium]
MKRQTFGYHHLNARLPKDELFSAFDLIGFPVVVKEDLAIALASRVEDTTNKEIKSLLKEGSLITINFPNGNKRVVLKGQWALFNKFLKPQNEEELLFFFKGYEPMLKALSLSVEELLNNALKVAETFKGDFENELLETLDTFDQEVFRWPSFVHNGENIGESLAKPLLNLVSLYYPIGLDKEELSVENNKDNLINRYLKGGGEENFTSFGQWCNILVEHAKRLWENSVIENHFSGEKQLLNRLNFLSRNDPLVEGTKRGSYLKGKRAYNYFLKNSENPNYLFYEGEVIGGWHFKEKGQKWTLLIEDITGKLERIATKEIEREVNFLSAALDKECEEIRVSKIL